MSIPSGEGINNWHHDWNPDSLSFWRKDALEYIRRHLENPVNNRSDFVLGSTWQADVGIILGTGWGEVLKKHLSAPFFLGSVSPFLGNLSNLPGHERTIYFGEMDGKRVAALSGRVHLYEEPPSPRLFLMVRLQVELLYALGIKKLIITNAVGSLRPKYQVGQVVWVRRLVTVFAPEMPLFAGEFVSPEDVLSDNLGFSTIAYFRGLPEVTYAMLRGPLFESRSTDKKILREAGADIVGMSLLPELCVAATNRKIPILALSFISNDDKEEHSHEENQHRAKDASDYLGSLLWNFVVNTA